MNQNRENLPAKKKDFSLASQGSLLDEALSKLPQDQQEKLLSKAFEKRLELDEERASAELRNQASSLDMVKTVQHVRDLEQSTTSDYTVNAEFNTASGRTNIEVKKSNNTMIIVITVVIGIVILLMFAD